VKTKYGFTNDLVDQLVTRVSDSTKYRAINTTLIRRIAEQELEKRGNLRDAIKATKNKLHQIGGAYIDHPIDYNKCIEELKIAHKLGREDFLQECQRVMCYHSSTRERLPIIDSFFHTLLADLLPVRKIIDIACGLNPLAIPWMGLPENVEYYAVDIYNDMVNFLGQYMDLVGIEGTAIVGDVITDCPGYPVDIAYLLKTIPCLEQVDKSAGNRLLTGIQAKHIVVSFPIHSLGGRGDKGMLENYSIKFNDIIVEHNWRVKRYLFPSELVFIVSK
jgi:16S rRNA (guanine(1405)-N(7))-methyltransferase